MIEEDARTITIVKSLSTKRERSDVFLYVEYLLASRLTTTAIFVVYEQGVV